MGCRHPPSGSAQDRGSRPGDPSPHSEGTQSAHLCCWRFPTEDTPLPPQARVEGKQAEIHSFLHGSCQENQEKKEMM